MALFANKQGSNELNKELLRRINEDGRIHTVPSESKGVYYLRFAVCSARTEATDIQFSWNVIQELAEKLINSNISALADH